MNTDQEFRHLFNERMNKLEGKIDELNKEMGSLKIKVAGFSSFIGSLAGFLINKFFH